MTLRNYSSEGIIISSAKYKDADNLLTLYTREYGKVFVLAKGARKLKSRKRGSVEVFNLIKFSASKTKGVDIINEVVLLNSFETLRKDLKKVSVAYFFAEVVKKITQDAEKNEKIFNHLVKYLNALEKREIGLRTLRKNFTFELLTISGYWPTGKKMTDHDKELEFVLERELYSKRVGKKISA